MTEEKKTNWKAVIIYYILACVIAWPFFWWRDIHPESWANWKLPGIVKTWTYMWGPAISVFIVTVILYKNRLKMESVSIFGNSVLRSLLFWFVPFFMLAVPGIPNNWHLNPHLFPIVAMGILGFISIVGEDSGWSYFLKNMLINISPIKRSLIIGVLWELWHFTNRTAQGPPLRSILGVLMMMVLLSGLTYVMSKITDRTKSLITAVTIHMWVNVLTENGSLSVYIVFGLSLVFWTFMYLSWNHPAWKMKYLSR